MKRTKTLMLQGTASGVGKSTLSIGICRLLHRKGFRVAPFKAQNLSDNAHILPDGRKMARSQAIAAAASGLSPDPDMNPVLLSPGRDGCEVIVNGRPVPRFERDACREAAHRAYERLCGRFDAVVAEGRRILETVCEVPVLGIIPHFNLHLEDEDSLPGAATVTREKLASFVPEGMSFEEFQEQQWDALADALAANLDVPALLRIMEAGA